MPELRTLMSGVVFGEQPRWHEGRLWFSDWGRQEVIAVDPGGNSEVVLRGASFPLCVDWLPDGSLLVVSARDGLLLRREHDGSLVTYGDLKTASDPPAINELVVDRSGPRVLRVRARRHKRHHLVHARAAMERPAEHVHRATLGPGADHRGARAPRWLAVGREALRYRLVVGGQRANEIVVDAPGNAYARTSTSPPKPGYIKVVNASDECPHAWAPQR
jgi:hypothetical protein